MLSSLVDKHVRDHLHGAGMQILTKQCEDEHDKEILYGPVSLAHKKIDMDRYRLHIKEFLPTQAHEYHH